MSSFLSLNAKQPPYLQVHPAVQAEHGSWNVSKDQLQHSHTQQQLQGQRVKDRGMPEAQESEVEQPQLKPPFSGGDRSRDYQKQHNQLEQQNRKRQIAYNQAIHQAVAHGLSGYLKAEGETRFLCMIPDQDCAELFQERDRWKWQVERKHTGWYQRFRDSVRYRFAGSQMPMSVRLRRRTAAAESTMVMASNDTNNYGPRPPVGDYSEDGSTPLAYDTGSFGFSPVKAMTDATSIILPSRTPARNTASDHETPVARQSTDGCVSHHPSSRAQYSIICAGHVIPIVEPMSPVQSSDDGPRVIRPESNTHVSDSSLGKLTILDHPKTRTMC